MIKSIHLLIFVVFAIACIYSLDVPKNNDEELKMQNQDDYRIKIANRHLKCISNYVNCDNKDSRSFPCDISFMKCINSSINRHVHSIENMRKKAMNDIKIKDGKIKIECTEN